jgi:hypothetical protein
MLRLTPFRVGSGVVVSLACLMVACDSAPSVAIGPRGPVSDAGMTPPVDARVIADARPAPLPPGESPFDRATPLVEPPGLVEGAAAQAVLAHAPVAVHDTVAGVDAYDFAPLQDGRWGEVRPITPDRGRGYGRGAGTVAELGISVAAGAAIVGFDDWETHQFERRYPETWVKAGGGPSVHPVAWYRAALDGSDAAAPPVLFEATEALTPFTLTADGRNGFVATPEGIWRVPLDGVTAPSLQWATPATRVVALAVLDGAGRLAFIEVAGAQMQARLWSLPLSGERAEPEALLDLGRFSGFELPETSRAAQSLLRVDDHRAWVRLGDHDDVVDLSGARPPLVLRHGPEAVYEVRIAGDHVVWLRSGDPEGEVVSLPLDALNADAAIVLGPSVRAARAGLVTGRAWAAWMNEDGLRIARTDGRVQHTIRLGASLASEPRFAFGPDGETLFICNASDVAVVPPGADAATPLHLPPGTVCDLGLLATLGQIGLFEFADPATPGLTMYTVDGAPVAHVELPFERACGLTPAGVLCRRRDRETTLHLAAAGRDVELQRATVDERWKWSAELTPGGRFVVVRVPGGVHLEHVAIALGGPPFVPVVLEPGTLAYREDAQIARSGGAPGEVITLRRVPLDTGAANSVLLDRVSAVLADLPRAGGILARAWVGGGVPDDLVFVGDDGRGTTRLLPAGEVPEIVGLPISIAAPGGGVAAVVMSSTSDGLDVTLLATEAGPRGVLGTAHVPPLVNPVLFELPTPGHVLVTGIDGGSDGPYRVEFSGNGDPPSVVDLARRTPETMSPEGRLRGTLDLRDAAADHGVVLADAWVDLGGGDLDLRLYAVRVDAPPETAWTPILPGVRNCNGGELTPDGRHAVVHVEDGTTWLVPTDGRGEARALFRRWSGTTEDEGCAFPLRLHPRLDARGRLVYIEPDTSRLIALDRDTGASETRFDPGSARGDLSVEALTPDGEAAVIRWHGPTGRRLYVVTLTGAVGVAALGPGDLDRDEGWIGFGAPSGP